MSSNRFNKFFWNVTRLTMTFILVYSAWILYKVIRMREGVSIELSEFNAVPTMIGYALICIVIYLVFSFIITVFQSSVHDSH